MRKHRYLALLGLLALVAATLAAPPAARAQQAGLECVPSADAGPYGAFVPNGWNGQDFFDYTIFTGASHYTSLFAQFDDPFNPPGEYIPPWTDFQVCVDPATDIHSVWFHVGGGTWTPFTLDWSSAADNDFNGFNVPTVVAMLFEVDPLLTASHSSCVQRITTYYNLGAIYCNAFHQQGPVAPPGPQTVTSSTALPTRHALLSSCGDVPGVLEAQALADLQAAGPFANDDPIDDNEQGVAQAHSDEVSGLSELYADAVSTLPTWALMNLPALIDQVPDFDAAFRTVARAQTLQALGRDDLIPAGIVGTGDLAGVSATLVSADYQWNTDYAEIDGGVAGEPMLTSLAENGGDLDIPDVSLNDNIGFRLLQTVAAWQEHDYDSEYGLTPSEMTELLLAACYGRNIIDYVGDVAAPADTMDLRVEIAARETWEDPVDLWADYPCLDPEYWSSTTGGSIVRGDVADSAAVAKDAVATDQRGPRSKQAAPRPASDAVLPDRSTSRAGQSPDVLERCVSPEVLNAGGALIGRLEWLLPNSGRWEPSQAIDISPGGPTVVIHFALQHELDAFLAAIQDPALDELDPSEALDARARIVWHTIEALGQPNDVLDDDGEWQLDPFFEGIEGTVVVFNSQVAESMGRYWLRQSLLDFWRRSVTWPSPDPTGMPRDALQAPEHSLVDVHSGLLLTPYVPSTGLLGTYAWGEYSPDHERIVMNPAELGVVTIHYIEDLDLVPASSSQYFDSMADYQGVLSHELVHLRQHREMSTQSSSSLGGASLIGISAPGFTLDDLADFVHRNLEAPAHRVWSPNDLACAAVSCGVAEIDYFGIPSFMIQPLDESTLGSWPFEPLGSTIDPTTTGGHARMKRWFLNDHF